MGSRASIEARSAVNQGGSPAVGSPSNVVEVEYRVVKHRHGVRRAVVRHIEAGDRGMIVCETQSKVP